MSIIQRYKEANFINNKETYTMLALPGLVGVGGLHRFLIALKAKDVQQLFLGAIYLLPLILVGLLWYFGESFQLWYLAPLIVTVGLTIHDLTSMDRLLRGELSAKKAWYETWPGRIGAIILFPIALWFLYKKTDLPKEQKNAIAGVLGAGFLALMGASFTGVVEDIAQTGRDGIYKTCDEVRAAGLDTPLETSHEAYEEYLDRDNDGLACE